MKKVFLDTNILISFLDSSRENHYLVKSLFVKLKNSCKVIYTDDKSNFPRLEIPLISSSNEIFYKI